MKGPENKRNSHIINDLDRVFFFYFIIPYCCPLYQLFGKLIVRRAADVHPTIAPWVHDSIFLCSNLLQYTNSTHPVNSPSFPSIIGLQCQASHHLKRKLGIEERRWMRIELSTESHFQCHIDIWRKLIKETMKLLHAICFLDCGTLVAELEKHTQLQIRRGWRH
jgi:hypothetical protein